MTAPRVSDRAWPSAATLVAGIIGDPVRHSLSPVIHSTAYREMGLDWVYVAFAAREGTAADAVAAMRALGLVGMSVTMPHKDGVAAAAGHRSETVERLTSANCLHWQGGATPWEGTTIAAESTDGPGLVDALSAAGSDVEGMRCAVLGTGGASRAVIDAFASAGASEVLVVSRSHERAAATAAALAPAVGRAGTEADLPATDIIVNGTPVGMSGKMAGLPIDPSVLSPGQLVVDLIYSPPETALLGAARGRGARIMNGLPMLVFQAARQIDLWTGMHAPRDSMLAAVGLDRASLVRP